LHQQTVSGEALLRDLKGRVMQIAVHDADARNVTDLRAYAEYRMFAAVTRFSRSCARIDVRLSERQTAREPYVCDVVLEMKPSGRVQVRATGERPYLAIDRAAERLSSGVERELGAGSRARAIGRADRISAENGREVGS
jgi:ribosome-associated translation inhibitor RaiA